MNWDDLRFLLAVANEGSAAAAARAIGVNHATVVRRVQSFERSQGLRIFDHLASGYRLTSEGEIFLEAAKSVNATINELERKTVGSQETLSGDVRITTTDGLFPMIVESLPRFREQYPEISLDFNINSSNLDLSTLDADIAIRVTTDPPKNLVGRRICEMAFAIYGAPALAASVDTDTLSDAPWLGMHAPLDSTYLGKWQSVNIRDESIVVRCNSFLKLLQVAETGVGISTLPCYIGDASHLIGRVTEKPFDHKNQIWMLSHGDVLRSPKVAACVDYFYDVIANRKDIIEGRVQRESAS